MPTSRKYYGATTPADVTPGDTPSKEEPGSRVALTARGEVPPAGDGDALRLARAGVILQPATGRLHGPPVDTRVEEAVLVEEAGADLAVALGKDAALAGDEAAELLGLPEALHLPAGGAAVTAAHPAEGVPLCPALDKSVTPKAGMPPAATRSSSGLPL